MYTTVKEKFRSASKSLIAYISFLAFLMVVTFLVIKYNPSPDNKDLIMYTLKMVDTVSVAYIIYRTTDKGTGIKNGGPPEDTQKGE